MAAAPNASNANDITTVISALASRQSARPKSKPLSGPKRAAILMLALGEQYGGKVWAMLDDDEVRELSIHMSTLGTVEADIVEDLLLEFVSRMSASGALMGTFDATERLFSLLEQRHGYRITGVVPNAFADHSKVPNAPGFAGIPVLDEVQLEKGIS